MSSGARFRSCRISALPIGCLPGRRRSGASHLASICAFRPATRSRIGARGGGGRRDSRWRKWVRAKTSRPYIRSDDRWCTICRSTQGSRNRNGRSGSNGICYRRVGEAGWLKSRAVQRRGSTRGSNGKCLGTFETGAIGRSVREGRRGMGVGGGPTSTKWPGCSDLDHSRADRRGRFRAAGGPPARWPPGSLRTGGRQASGNGWATAMSYITRYEDLGASGRAFVRLFDEGGG